MIISPLTNTIKFETEEEQKEMLRILRNHGKWKRVSPAGIYECSECGINVMTDDIDVYSFCHGCGADMTET